MDQEIKKALEEMKNDAMWRGYVQSKLETILQMMSDFKTLQAQYEAQQDRKLCAFQDSLAGLRAKVAGWSALFGSIGAAIMYFVVRAIAQ